MFMMFYYCNLVLWKIKIATIFAWVSPGNSILTLCIIYIAMYMHAIKVVTQISLKFATTA